jgi:hypothetical protein
MKQIQHFIAVSLPVMVFLVGLAISNPLAASQCGVFGQIPTPDPATADGPVSHLAALSDGTAWAVGSQSGETVLLYFDGLNWSAQLLLPEVQGIAFSDSTSTPNGDVWLTGTRSHDVYNVEVLFMRMREGEVGRIDSILSPRAPIDISASSSSDVWALTTAGDIIQFDGSTWGEMDVPAPFQRLYPKGIYAAGDDDVWVVGYGGNGRGEYIGYVQHWDGGSWSTVPTPFEGLRNHFFRGVDGSGSNDVWIVGYINYSQTIALHWNGTDWTERPGPPSDAPFLDVAALKPGDAWATAYSQADAQLIYHWDGNAWRGMAPLTPPEGSTPLWRGLAKAGSCDLWSTASYTIGSENRALIARLQPGVEEATVFVQGVTVERPFPSADHAEALVSLSTTVGNQAAAAVQVFGTFTGPGSTVESVSAVTNDSGVAILSSPAVAENGAWCFDVTQVTAAGLLYDPTQNVVSGACEVPTVDTAVFVNDIAVTKVRMPGRMFQGQAVVTLMDTDQLPVAGSSVTGAFSGPTNETLTVMTDAEGRATFSSGSVSRRSARSGWCFTVNSVLADGYDPALDQETSDCSGN